MFFWIYLILSVIGFLLLLPHYLRRREWKKVVDRIPAPKGYPIIGNMYDFWRLPPDKRIQGFRDIFEEQGPIFRHWGGPIRFINVASVEVAEIVLSSNAHITKGSLYKCLTPWLGDGLITSTGNKWRKMRKTLTPMFHFSILQTYIDIVTKNSQILTERLEKETDKFDISPFVTECAMDIICETALGVKMNFQRGSSKEYLHAVHTITKMIADRVCNVLYHVDFIHSFTDNYRKQQESLKILHDMSSSVIKQRIQEKQHASADILKSEERRKKTFLDLLLDSEERLTFREIRDEVDTFMFAGHDTISVTLSWAIFLIGCNPEVHEKIITELDDVFGSSDRQPTIHDLSSLHYLECAIKDSLRLYPPVAGLARDLGEPIKFGTYTIPTGTYFALHVHAIHRSPKHYENPNKFNPANFYPEKTHRRHPFAFIPFSAGPRNCIGQKFAMLEMKIILSSLYRKYRIVSLEKEDEISVVPDTVLRPENGIWVEVSQRS